MIIYNVTVKVNSEINDDWKKWMKEVHIPDVMNTGMFLESKMMRVISIDESEGITYAIQYFCKDMATLHQYQVKFAPKLQKEHTERYKEKFVAFRTLMEVI